MWPSVRVKWLRTPPSFAKQMKHFVRFELWVRAFGTLGKRAYFVLYITERGISGTMVQLLTCENVWYVLWTWHVFFKMQVHDAPRCETIDQVLTRPFSCGGERRSWAAQVPGERQEHTSSRVCNGGRFLGWGKTRRRHFKRLWSLREGIISRSLAICVCACNPFMETCVGKTKQS